MAFEKAGIIVAGSPSDIVGRIKKMRIS